MADGNLFNSMTIDPDREVFDLLLEQPGLRIERIVSTGQSSPENDWYDQNQSEWVLVLRGAATLSFADADDQQLETGDYLNIPAHQKHRVKWTDPNRETVWLAIHYSP